MWIPRLRRSSKEGRSFSAEKHTAIVEEVDCLLATGLPEGQLPLSCINLIVDSTAGHLLLNFMDAYAGYNQIRMNLNDKEKTTFITERGLYYYKAMPFGLKNVGVTYP